MSGDHNMHCSANQLADELAFKHIAGDDSGAFSNKIITMLRQQQAEINRLKSLCISYIDEEWSGTSSYQAKIDEVKNERK
jgi:hypothetical protein